MMYTSQEGELYLGQARALGAVGVMPKQIKQADVSKVLYELHLLPDRRSRDPSGVRPVTLDALAEAAVAAERGRRQAFRESRSRAARAVCRAAPRAGREHRNSIGPHRRGLSRHAAGHAVVCDHLGYAASQSAPMGVGHCEHCIDCGDRERRIVVARGESTANIGHSAC